MKLTRDAWLSIGLLVTLIVIMTFVALSQQQQSQDLPALTSLSAAPDGALALKLWLQKLDYTVIEYDKTTMDILSKLVMLNIARSHQHQPMHLAMTRNTILLNIR